MTFWYGNSSVLKKCLYCLYGNTTVNTGKPRLSQMFVYGKQKREESVTMISRYYSASRYANSAVRVIGYFICFNLVYEKKTYLTTRNAKQQVVYLLNLLKNDLDLDLWPWPAKSSDIILQSMQLPKRKQIMQ